MSRRDVLTNARGPGVLVHGVEVDAVILDLDGVITRTARLHARAWKEMFDEYLRQRGEAEGKRFPPLSIEDDYRGYIDGKPRYDGAQSFLRSRGMELPFGQPSDAPGSPTVCGLGNRKNEVFQRLLEAAGAEVFPDAVEQIRRWRKRGLKTAVVSSSKNCAAVLRASRLEDLFDARVDGAEAERDGLPGKPKPDFFLRAAKKLGVEASRAAIVEDAVAGVEAGRAGHFALVVGVARDGRSARLEAAGADVVVSSLDELETAERDSASRKRPPSALERFAEIAALLKSKEAAIFLDYDGTLTPIVSQPEQATLSEAMRDAVRRLASRHFVAIVSGREREDVKQLVGIDGLTCAGSHGLDIEGTGIRKEHEGGTASLADLEEAQRELGERLRAMEGVRVERKRFAVAVHYRNAREEDVPWVEHAVDEVNSRHPKLRKQGGKKIFELRPDIDWDKGKAILWILDVLELKHSDVVPLYLGDDVTDEDAFRALADRGIGIVVGDETLPTAACYWLRSPSEVNAFLRKLVEPSEEQR